MSVKVSNGAPGWAKMVNYDKKSDPKRGSKAEIEEQKKKMETFEPQSSEQNHTHLVRQCSNCQVLYLNYHSCAV